jgi:plastocyanin
VPTLNVTANRRIKMNKRFIVTAASMWAVALTVLIGKPADQDLTDKPAVQDAVVDFGAPHPQPASPGHHVLSPDDVTIFKGGTVTFVMNGTGHGIAIYPVSKNTTRAHISDDLCQGGPALCNTTTHTAQRQYLITDGKGTLVIDTGVFPDQRVVDHLPGQLLSAGTGILLTGSTPTTAGTQVRHRFAEDGRYLVICINRVHSINDWMFGFVNVV